MKNKNFILLTGMLILIVLSLVFASADRSFTVYNASNVSQPYLSVNGTTGNVGAGVENATSLLQLLNNGWISARNYIGTGAINMFKVNANNQIEVGSTLNIGSFEFTEDSGLVTFVDMPVSSTPSAGTPESYVFKIDGENMMSIYAESDALGGIQNKRIGINTTSPKNSLNVVGDGNFTGTLYVLGVNISVNNESMKNYVDLGDGRWNSNYTNMQTNCGSDFVTGIYPNGTFKCASISLGAEEDPYWGGNYTNMQTNCGSDFVTGIFSNGTFKCASISLGAEEDPYWNANYTAFNESWSYTFNQTTNDSINNYVAFVNGSMKNYVDEQNTSQTNWANSVFVAISNLVDMIGNWSADKVNYYNTTQVDEINVSMGNYVNYSNATLYGIMNNGSYLNYPWNATNESYALFNDLNNGSYLNYPWNATNESYMTGENFTLQNISMQNYIAVVNTSMNNTLNYYIPYIGANKNINFGNNNLTINGTTLFVDTNKSRIGIGTITPVNIFNVIGDGNFTGTVYALGANLSLNNESMKNYVDYVNSTNNGGTNWNNNYSIFLTHITFGDVSNGTIWSWVMNGTIAKSSELNNGTYVTNLILNNGSYLNYPWNATNESYALFNDLNNGSYLNYPWNSTNESYMTGENFTLQNISMQNYIAVVNTSMNNTLNYYIPYIGANKNINFGNNNLTINGTTLFVDTNKSRIGIGTITPVNTFNVIGDGNFTGDVYSRNEKLINWTTINNGTLWAQMINATTEPKWNANFTAFNASWSSITNASYISWNSNYNSSVWSWVMNGTMVKSSELNNGTYMLTVGDTATGNYTFDSPTLHIDSTNNRVGIGTTTPQNNLNVIGDGNFTGDVYSRNEKLINWTTINNGTLWAQMINATTEPKWNANFTAFNASWSSITNTSYMLNTGDTATGNYTFDADTFFIDSTNNRVGIGIITPEALLDLRGTGVTGTAQPVLTLSTPEGNIPLGSVLGRINWTGDDDGFGMIREEMGFIELRAMRAFAGGQGETALIFGAKSSPNVIPSDILTVTGTGGGRVGVNTTTPTHLLNIVGASTVELNLSEAIAGSAAQMYFTNPTRTWEVGGDSNPDGFYIGTPAGTQDMFFIDSVGNVGIGTSTPGQLLDVDGNASFGVSGATGFLISRFTSALEDIPGSGSGIQLTGPVNAHLVVDVQGNDANDGFYVRIPEVLASTTANKTAFSVKSSGKVGINTSTPANALNVLGDGNFTGDVYSRNEKLINWTTINNGTLWAQMINATTEPKWNANFTAFNASWSSITNTSYMLNTGDTATGNYTFDSPTFHIDSTNNRAGIGTTTPDDVLDVQAANSQLRLTDSDDSTFIQFSYSGTNLAIRPNGGVTDLGLFIKNTGRVGINTSTTDSVLTLGSSSVINNISFGGRVFVTGGLGSSNEIPILLGSNVIENSTNFLLTPDSAKAGAYFKAWTVLTNSYASIGTANSAGTATERLRIDNAGQVGIGTTAPAAILHLNGSDATPLILQRNNGNNVNINFTNTEGTLFAGMNSNEDFAVGPNQDLASSPWMVIDSSNGDVGIGTTSPTGALTINASTAMGTGGAERVGNIVLLSDSVRTANEGPSIAFAPSSNTGSVNSAYTQAEIIGAADNSADSNAAGRLIFRVKDYYNDGGGLDWNWRTGMVIDRYTRVGINTTTPQNPLNVIGDGNFTGTLYALGVNLSANNQSLVNYIAVVNTSMNNTLNYYIPYIGANKNINFGNNNLTINGTTLFVDANKSRIGIGTTTPTNALNVIGDGNFTGDVYSRNEKLINWTTINNGTLWAQMINATTEPKWNANFTAFNASWSSITNTSYMLNTGDTATGNYTFDTDTFFIDSTNNRVGMGTTTPGFTLDVDGAARFGISSTSGLNITRFASALVDIPGTTTGMQIVGPVNAHLVVDVQGNDANDGFYVRVPEILVSGPEVNKTAFSVKASGKVGINTSTPANTLNVIGDGNFTGDVYSRNEKLINWTTINNGTLWAQMINATTEPKWNANFTAFNASWSSITNTSYMLNTGDTATGNYTFDTPTLHIDSTRNRVGIGTTNPLGGVLNIVGGNVNMSNNSIIDVWKLTFASGGTWDPPYRVGNTVYSTYGSATVGYKEETSGNAELKKGEYIIDFSKLERGSDLWLFYQVTDLGDKWENMQVMLTPGFNGNVWYKKDPQNKKLTIYGSSDGEVSYRLTANGWNWRAWGNVAHDLNASSYTDMGEKR